MVNQNQLLKEKFRASEQKANNRFRLQNPISISGGFYHAVATPKLTCALIGFGVAKAEAPISEPSESSDKIYLILWFESRRVFGVINKLLVGNIFHSKLLQVDLVHNLSQISLHTSRCDVNVLCRTYIAGARASLDFFVSFSDNADS